MSVVCEIAFGDPVVTRMTVWSDFDGFEIGHALLLAHYAYESRMHRPPPEIVLRDGLSVPHILALRYETADGQRHIIEGDKIMRMLPLSAALDRASKR
jgi:hypothetical protein